VTKSRNSEVTIPKVAGMKADVAPANPGAVDVAGMLDSIDIPIVVVDCDCNVTRFNRAAADVLDVAPSDIGHRPCRLKALAHVPEIEHVCIRVMADEVPSRHDLRNGDRWFLVRISPYLGADRMVSGAAPSRMSLLFARVLVRQFMSGNTRKQSSTR
jgi:hypothetical protein